MEVTATRFYSAIAIIGAVVAALTLAVVLSTAANVWAGAPVCANNVCTLTDTTTQDFATGQAYLTGLRSLGDGEVQLLPVGVTSNWVTDTNSLPQPRKELAAAIYRDNIFVVGGFNSGGFETNSIYSATTFVNGGIAPPGWTVLGTLPDARASHAVVVSDTGSGGYLYVLGGSSGGVITNSVIYRAFDGNGTLIGSWHEASSLPGPSAYLQAVVHGGFLYAIGGHDTSLNFSSIVKARINADGSLQAWDIPEANSIPDSGGQVGRHSFAAIVWQSGVITDYLYIIGGLAGDLGSESAVADVSFAPFNPDGSIGAWTAASTLSNAFRAHGAVQGGGEIFVTAGSEGVQTSQAITKVQAALIDNTSGGLKDLGGGVYWVVSTPLYEPRMYHANVENSGGQIFIIGGEDQTGTPKSTVYRGSSAGLGNVYAPAGSHSSRVINFGGSYQVNSVNWNTSLLGGNSETMTLQYRIANTQGALPGQPWTAIGNAPPGINVTNTYSFANVFGAYFQYRVLLTTTAPYTHSPALNLIELHYSANGPDLQVSKSDGLSVVQVGQALTYTVYYTNSDSRTVPGVVLTETAPLSTTFVGGTAGWSPVAGGHRMLLGSLSPSATGTITYVVQVNGRPAGGALNNNVEIAYDNSFGLDRNPTNNVSIDADSVAAVDLVVSTTDQKSFVVVSSTNVYSTSFGNSGQLSANNVVITDTIPPNTRYTGGPAWTSVGNGVFVHSVGTLSPGATAAISFSIWVSDTLVGSLTNTVQIAYDGANGLDGNTADNSFSDIDNVLSGGPDLAVAKSDGRSNVLAGDVLTYTISYNNLGGTTATNVRLTETLPANTTFLGPAGWTFVGGATYIRTVSDVNPGFAGSAQFIVQVNGNAPTGPLTNTVRIGASNESGPALNNNTATDVDSVGYANLRISKDDGVGVVTPGQTMTYSIVYRNVATTTATNVVITETPPLALVSPLNTTGWNQVGNEFTRNLGSVAPGVTSTLTFAVQTLNGDSDGTLVTNTVRIRADNDDVSQLADNVATDTDVVKVGGAPDLRISGASVGLAVPGHPVAIVVTVTNAGPVATSLGFFSDVYADRVPVDRNDLGDSRADSGGILGAGQSRQINLAWTFATPGLHQLNFQVDTCDPLYCLNPSYGRVAESNEANNMFGPINLNISSSGNFVYLPLIRR